jgi:hypothetical protein
VKPSGAPRRNTTPLAHEWIEVADVPFAGKAPTLPREVDWQVQTRRWWAIVTAMPHCVLWTDSEWRVAIETAYVADAFYAGKVGAAVELRRREAALGMTLDSRRDLRIRYVAPAEMAPEVSRVAPSDPRARLRVVEGDGGAA